MNSPELIFLIISAISVSAYVVLIVSLTYGWKKLRSIRVTEKPFTFISVIIPVRNEEQNVEKLLQALKEIDYPVHLRDFIFIDDHSEDNTVDTLKRLNETPGLVIHTLPEDKKGKKEAITYGVELANGKLITTLDADCIPGKYWLHTISSIYESKKYKMIAGPVAIQDPKGWLASFQALELISLVASGAGAIGIGKPIMCNGANLSYEKEAFIEVKGFEGNEHISGGDDMFLMEKFNKQYSKFSIGFNKNHEGIVYTSAARNLNEFMNQRIRWVSKSPAYRDPFLILSSIIVLMLSLNLFATLVYAFFSLPVLFIFLGLFLIKCLVDYPVLWKVSIFTLQGNLLRKYIPFQFFYFIFVSVSGTFGLLSLYSWKGRTRQ
jgi:cellulose synthase/poly-beta-1,6-N-acetylglucosamine synthase-like glycosyltransferase